MSLYIHQKGSSIPVGGGMSQSEKDRLSELEILAAQLQEQISDLKSSLATETKPGLVRLSSSESVTDSTGISLSASEKNAAIPGTLANKIKNISDSVSFKKQSTNFIGSADPDALKGINGSCYSMVGGTGCTHLNFIAGPSENIQFRINGGTGTVHLRTFLSYTGKWTEWKSLG